MIKILVYEARIKEGLSLRKLSELTGISKSRLNNIENGKRSPTIEELEKISKSTKTDFYDLLETNHEWDL